MERRSGRVGERIDDAVDDLLDQHLVLAFAHDADHRLGARRAHDQPTMTVEAGFRILDGAAHPRGLERLSARVAYGLEHLPPRVGPGADFGYPPPLLLHHRPHP